LEAGIPYNSTAVPGQKQNCQSFGAFSFEHDTINDPMSALCYGGVYDRRYWSRCGAHDKCRANSTPPPNYDATRIPQRRSLTVLPNSYSPTAVIASTPASIRYQGQAPQPGFLGSLPTTLGHDRMRKDPVGLGTPGGYHGTSPSPTYLPNDEQGVFVRLIMNIGNGIIGAIGWHLWAYAQQVDIFGKRT
jgi:hypothetical protein